MHLTNAEADALVNRAELLARAGRLKEAESLCRAALDLDSENLKGRTLLGMLLSSQGDQTGAIEQLDRALNLGPDLFEALMWRSIAAQALGDIQTARTFAERAVAASPENFQGHNNLGLCLMSEGRYSEAIASLNRAVDLNPNQARTHFNLGIALDNHGMRREAIEAYGRALSVAPDFTDALVNLATVHQALGNVEEALKHAKQAVRLAPRSPVTHLLLSGLYIERGETAEGLRHLEIGSSLEGAGQRFGQRAGKLLNSLGRMEEAAELLRKDIELYPVQGVSYCYLVYGQKSTENDRPLVDAMKRIAKDHPLATHESAALHYALGKTLEDLGEYEESMLNYDAANDLTYQIRFGDGSFDASAYKRSHDSIIGLFRPEVLKGVAGEGDPSETPIFILGMMRSGTTLLEQILSSHSQVDPAGEQTFWTANWHRMVDPSTGEVSSARADELAKEYLETIARFGHGAVRVTDKMPRNYVVAGAIRLAFPKARIVHVRRHPVDTCLSIYTTPNRAEVEYAYSRRGIVTGYQEYRRLMTHWESVLPGDNWLTIDYEDLVTDRERVIRELVEFCGLPWEDACLSPELNPRPVETPSAWQVRQPMYSSSIGRWRRFEPWLKEFAELLPSATIR